MRQMRGRLGLLGFVLVLAAIVGCGPKKPEAIEAADLVGPWELTSGDETERLDLAANGSFTGTINRDGFMATTLYQGPHVSIEGAWRLSGHTVTFDLTGSSEAELIGQKHSYTILGLSDRDMDTLDAQGQRKTLLRGR